MKLEPYLARASPIRLETGSPAWDSRAARRRTRGDRTLSLTPALAPLFDRPVVFFGHCLGGVVMFEVAQALRREYGVEPAHFVVSGARAPQFYYPEQFQIDVMQFSPVRGTPGHKLDEANFLTFLKDLNFDTSAALYENAELREIMIPTVQADLEVNNVYTYAPLPPLTMPITAVGGRSDPYVAGIHVLGWREMTTGPYECHIRPGDHYFIETERPFLVKLVASVVAGIGATSHARIPPVFASPGRPACTVAGRA